MGGSLGLAVRQGGFARHVVGWGRRESALQKARELGAIDAFNLDLAESLAKADAVVVATPTQFSESLIVEVVGQVSTDTIVTDVASVKGNLAKALIAAYGEVPRNVVLAHPICGSEQSGVEAARGDLYQAQKVVLIEDVFTDSINLDRIQSLWALLGADVRKMTLKQHDSILALTSHLPHILSYALMNQLGKESDECDVFQLSGGGFRDFTRIAASDPLMWREISLANKKQLLDAIDGFGAELQALKKHIVAGEGDALELLFSQAKDIRQNKVPK